MVRRSTWILLVIFAFLVGFTWLFQRYQAKRADNSATSTPTITLVSIYTLNGKQINELKISDSAGSEVEFYRDAVSAQWAITDVNADQADSFQIESIIAQLLAMKAQQTLTQTPPLDSIGLDTPAYTIVMTTSEGEQYITYVGSQTPIGSGYYIRVSSGPVAVVDKVVMDDVLNMLTNPPLIPTNTPEPTPTDTVSPLDTGAQETPTP